MMAGKGLLWVGTSVGCVLSLPLPRLEGVPQIRGRPSVSYHTHNGPVKFLTSIHCGMAALRPQPSTPTLSTPSETGASMEDLVEGAQPNGYSHLDLNIRGFTKSADCSIMMHHSGQMANDLTLGGALRSRWISTPDLYTGIGSNEERMESLHALYGSLMRGLDDDFDVDLDTPKVKRRSKNMLSNLNAVSHRVSKLSGAMLNRLISQDHGHGNRASTLPVLHEDTGSSHGNSSSDNVSSGSHHRDSWINSADITDKLDEIVIDENSPYENVDIIKQHQSQKADLPAPEPHYENAGVCRNGNYDQSISTETTDSQSDMVVRAPVMQASHVYNKAVVVVSGGEGHSNWNSLKNQDVKSEDTCLLLWQCPP